MLPVRMTRVAERFFNAYRGNRRRTRFVPLNTQQGSLNPEHCFGCEKVRSGRNSPPEMMEMFAEGFHPGKTCAQVVEAEKADQDKVE